MKGHGFFHRKMKGNDNIKQENERKLQSSKGK